MTHPTDSLVWQCVLRVLLEAQEGRHVAPSRLAWAREMAAKNRSKVPEDLRRLVPQASALEERRAGVLEGCRD